MQDFDANVILLNKITNSTDKKKSLKLHKKIIQLVVLFQDRQQQETNNILI